MDAELDYSTDTFRPHLQIDLIGSYWLGYQMILPPLATVFLLRIVALPCLVLFSHTTATGDKSIYLFVSGW